MQYTFNFYLTDKQIAEAIIKYLPDLLQEHQNPFVLVEQLVDRLDGILSFGQPIPTGRSIHTLLNNSEAKAILDSSEFFQIYQSEAYKNRQKHPVCTEEDYLKPKI